MLNYSWVILLLLHYVLSQTTDKYSDEDRPYKFGFNIQGYQHRQEEKDERGLIKGEYGFITADGYYRVTVYATDENGDFKIISMKNYYVGFPPEDPTTTPGSPSDRARQPQSFEGRAPVAAGRALPLDYSTTTPKPYIRPQGIAACSDCSIPTTTQRTNQASVGAVEPRNGRTESNFGSAFGKRPAGQSPQFPAGRKRVQTPPGEISQFQAQVPGQTPTSPQGGQRSENGFSGTGPSTPANPGNFFESPQRFGGVDQYKPVDGAFGSRDSGSPKGRNDFTETNHLTDIPQRRPQVGELREGLPPGVTVNDIRDLLYTFNYTVGFHGHHEDGYRNGDKQGDYFFDGRDGVERKVEYIANEFGYQPNITLIDLPENDVRRPNELTEKEYGLKGYEFKWFYRK